MLFQCPPTLHYDADLLDGVPRRRCRRTARRTRWSSATRRGRRRATRCSSAGVAWCVAETDEKDPKPEDLSWEPVGYLRLRKTEYSDEELATWAERIRPALDAGATVFCYFKHEDEGASPKMAKRLEAMLQVPAASPAAPLPDDT